MNEAVKHVCEVASKETKFILGLMSGTSLDGLDVALCKITGSGRETDLELLAFKTISYPRKVIEKLKKAVSVEEVSLQELTILNSWLGNFHAELILEALLEWKIKPEKVDCIASHGQTVFHAPETKHQQKEMPNATLQMGDGDHIARKTGILTISDFRQKHSATGGEGAPMAALFDELLFMDENEDRLLLNIGGIANFTYLPARSSESVTTDSGPGNTLINKASQICFGKLFDKDGAIAKKGSVHTKLLNQLLDHPFFEAPMPKSTGPETFNIRWVRIQQEISNTTDISGEDLIATLTRLSARTIADTIKKVSKDSLPNIYMSGGGMHNKQLIQHIEQLLNTKLHSFEDIGFNPDAKEAAIFAVLANETLSGDPFTIHPKDSADTRVNFGKISLPI